MREINKRAELMFDLAVKNHFWFQTGSTREGDARRKGLKPGEGIFSLPQEQRDLLKNLKSDDIKDIRLLSPYLTYRYYTTNPTVWTFTK